MAAEGFSFELTIRSPHILRDTSGLKQVVWLRPPLSFVSARTWVLSPSLVNHSLILSNGLTAERRVAGFHSFHQCKRSEVSVKYNIRLIPLHGSSTH
jgi:hypothetical protein